MAQRTIKPQIKPYFKPQFKPLEAKSHHLTDSSSDHEKENSCSSRQNRICSPGESSANSPVRNLKRKWVAIEHVNLQQRPQATPAGQNISKIAPFRISDERVTAIRSSQATLMNQIDKLLEAHSTFIRAIDHGLGNLIELDRKLFFKIEDSDSTQKPVIDTSGSDKKDDKLDNTPQPVEIVDTCGGKGRNIRYRLRWTDGTTSTYQTKEVQARHPQLLKEFRLKSRRRATNRYYKKKVMMRNK